MLRSYLLIAWRNIRKRKGFSLINILGLAAGLAICMLIMILIRDQNSYDDFHAKGDRIYRVISDRKSNSPTRLATAPLALYPALESKYPGLDRVTRILRDLSVDMEYDQNLLPVQGLWVEPAFFDIFSFPLREGHAQTALRDPYSVVLSADLAEKMGLAPGAALGQSVRLGDLGEFQVTGVMDEPEGKTHLEFELLASWSTLRPLQVAGKMRGDLEEWDYTDDGFVYLLLQPGARPAQLEAQLSELSEVHYAGSENYRLDFELQGLAAITPSRILENDMLFTVPLEALYFLSILALLVTLTACFNYTNLTVAKALTRTREIGVRKVTGARRGQLFGQFLIESVLTALFALVAAYAMLELVLIPLFKTLFVNRFFDMNFGIAPEMHGWFLLLSLVVGLLAGFLPAFYLSGLPTLQVLKPFSEQKVFAGLGWRKALIGLQFTVSLVFVTTVVVLFQQTRFMVQADYGFDKENVLNLRLQGQDFMKVKDALAADPDILAISGCSVLPATGSNQATYIQGAGMKEPMLSHLIAVEGAYMRQMDLAIAAGRALDEESPEDHIVINETLARRMGFDQPAAALGEPLTRSAGSDSESRGQIVGVVEDFYYLGMERAIENLIIFKDPERIKYANLRMQSDDLPGALARIEAVWKELDPVHPADYSFYDEQIGEIVGVYRDLMKMLGFLALVAILITALGMLGIAAYSVQTRTKEIGIRKVLGAEVGRIIWTLSKGLLLPVALSLALALPLSWLLNRLWLEGVAYHIELNAFNLGIGVVLLLLISAAMVGSQAYRLAIRNPVETLRDE